VKDRCRDPYTVYGYDRTANRKRLFQLAAPRPLPSSPGPPSSTSASSGNHSTARPVRLGQLAMPTPRPLPPAVPRIGRRKVIDDQRLVSLSKPTAHREQSPPTDPHRGTRVDAERILHLSRPKVKPTRSPWRTTGHGKTASLERLESLAEAQT
jgi:hypothetical protein